MNIKLRPKDPGLDFTFTIIKVLIVFTLSAITAYFLLQQNWLNVGLTVALGCVLVFMYELTWPRPIPLILINNEGINDIRLGIGVIKWSEIEDVQIEIEQSRSYLGLRLKDPQAILQRLPTEQREIWLANPLGFSVLSLKTAGLQVNLVKLVPVIRKQLRNTEPR